MTRKIAYVERHPSEIGWQRHPMIAGAWTSPKDVGVLFVFPPAAREVVQVPVSRLGAMPVAMS